MASHRILQLNAGATAACAIALLATRQLLPPLFSLTTPLVTDAIAIAFLAYAAALAVVAARPPVTRPALLFFAASDALWVAFSAIVLVLFWRDLAPLARFLVIAVALVVEVFATLQFRAAGGAGRLNPRLVMPGGQSS